MKLRMISEEADDDKVLIRYKQAQISIGEFCKEHNIAMQIKNDDTLPKIDFRSGKPTQPRLGLFIKQASELSDYYSELLEFVEQSERKAIDMVRYGDGEVFPDNSKHEMNFEPEIFKLTYERIVPGYLSDELGIDPLKISDIQAQGLMQQLLESDIELDGPFLMECTITASVKFKEYLVYLYGLVGLDDLIGEHKNEILGSVINNYNQDVEAIYSATIEELITSERSDYDESPGSAYVDELVEITKPIHKYNAGYEGGHYSSYSLSFVKPSTNDRLWPADWRENPVDDYYDGPKIHLDVSWQRESIGDSYGEGSTPFGFDEFYVFKLYYTNDSDDHSSEEKARQRRLLSYPTRHNLKTYQFSGDEEDDALKTLAVIVSKFEKM